MYVYILSRVLTNFKYFSVLIDIFIYPFKFVNRLIDIYFRLIKPFMFIKTTSLLNDINPNMIKAKSVLKKVKIFLNN